MPPEIVLEGDGALPRAAAGAMRLVAYGGSAST